MKKASKCFFYALFSFSLLSVVGSVPGVCADDSPIYSLTTGHMQILSSTTTYTFSPCPAGGTSDFEGVRPEITFPSEFSDLPVVTIGKANFSNQGIQDGSITTKGFVAVIDNGGPTECTPGAEITSQLPWTAIGPIKNKK